MANMFDVLADSVVPTLITAATKASNLTLRSKFGMLVSEHQDDDVDHVQQNATSHPGRIDFLYIFLLLPDIWAILSNIMVIVTISRTAAILRSFAYVMISLSFVDLCSSILVIPFSIYFFSNYGHWDLGYPLCVFWITADVMFCTASICHHCAIALHRYLMISSPHEFSVTNNHKILCQLIVPAWSVSAFIASILVIRSTFDRDLIYAHGTCGLNDRAYAIYSSIVSFFIPLSIIVAVSLRSIIILQQRIANKRRNSHSYHKTRKTTFTEDDHDEQPEPDLDTRRVSIFPQKRRLAKSRRHLDKEKNASMSERVIFSSKFRGRGHVKRATVYRHKPKPAAPDTLLKAFENFTASTFAIVPPEEINDLKGDKFNGLMIGFAPRARQMKPTLFAKRRSVECQATWTQHTRDQTEDTNATVTASSERPPVMNFPNNDPEDTTLSLVTENILQEFSLSNFNCTTDLSQNYQVFSAGTPLTSRTPSVLRRNSTTTSLPSITNTTEQLGRTLSMPDIDSTSVSSEGTLFYKLTTGPLSITEISALNYSRNSSSETICRSKIAPPPPPLTPPPPPSLPLVATTQSKEKSKKTKHGGSRSIFGAKTKGTAAPLAHMNSLERFDSFSVTAGSPLVRTRTYCAVKRYRHPAKEPSSKNDWKSSATPKPSKKLALGMSLSTGNTSTVCESTQKDLEIVEYRPSHHSLQKAIGGPLVPEHFLEMVRKKDHERQVALIKRGRTLAGIHRNNTSMAQLNRNPTSFLRSVWSRRRRKPSESENAMQSLSRRIRKERAAGHALIVVLLCFVFMWAPFFSLNMAYGICGECIDKNLFTLFTWLGWASCGVNPIIYTLCSRPFRQGLFSSLKDIYNRICSIRHLRLLQRHDTLRSSTATPPVHKRQKHV